MSTARGRGRARRLSSGSDVPERELLGIAAPSYGRHVRLVLEPFLDALPGGAGLGGFTPNGLG